MLTLTLYNRSFLRSKIQLNSTESPNLLCEGTSNITIFKVKTGINFSIKMRK